MLSCDIRSIVDTTVVYVVKYEQVNVVSDCGRVLIVEGAKGKRFPVPAEYVVEECEAVPEPPPGPVKPVKYIPPSVFNQAPAVKQVKKSKQVSLF